MWEVSLRSQLRSQLWMTREKPVLYGLIFFRHEFIEAFHHLLEKVGESGIIIYVWMLCLIVG